VLRTSLRSAIHATDSTCSGWTANRAATNALRPVAPVMRRKRMNTSSVFVTWITRLVTWYAPASVPNNVTSIRCDSHVIGCQYGEWPVVSAHHALFQLSPPRTVGFSVM